MEEVYNKMNRLYEDFRGDCDAEEITFYINSYEELHKKFIKLVKDFKETTQETLRLTSYMFITINPIEDVSLKDLLKTVDKYVNRTLINEYIYVVEQRGTNQEELGKGIHIHLLVKTSYKKPSDFKRDTISTFKKIVDCYNTPNWYRKLNLKPCDTEDDVKRRKEYMLGTKKDELKQVKQNMDKVFREKYNLRPYYCSINFKDI